MNRTFFILALILTLCTCVRAQSESLAVETTDEPLSEAVRIARQKFIRNYRLGQKTNFYIPLRIHVFQGDSGSIDLAGINAMVDEVNVYLAPDNLELQVCGAPVLVVDTAFSNWWTTDEQPAFDNGYFDQYALNLYIVDTVLATGYDCGYHYPGFNSGRKVIVRTSGCLDGKLFARSLGATFSLMNTHESLWGGCNLTDELVDGSNCLRTGDNLCDTPADPNLSPTCNPDFVDGDCNYVGTVTDANGSQYRPLTDNLMSFAPLACRQSFTPDQFAAMRFFMGAFYPHLICLETIVHDNLTCVDATRIECGDVVSDNLISIDSLSTAPSCYNRSLVDEQALWYTIRGAGQDVRLNLFDISARVDLKVYGGDCAAPICVPVRYYVDDTGQRVRSFYAAAGKDYKLVVYGPESQFNFAVSCVPETCRLPNVTVSRTGEAGVEFDWDAGVHPRLDVYRYWVFSNTWNLLASAQRPPYQACAEDIHENILVFQPPCANGDQSISVELRMPNFNRLSMPPHGCPRNRHISRVSIGDFTRLSGPDMGHWLHTEDTLSLVSGESYDIRLGASNRSGFPVFSDWSLQMDVNTDGRLDRPEEIPFDTIYNHGGSELWGRFTVPLTNASGVGVFRVLQFPFLTPKGQDGEVEDYIFRMTPRPEPLGQVAAFGIPLNCGDTVVSVFDEQHLRVREGCSSANNELNYKWFSYSGTAGEVTFTFRPADGPQFMFGAILEFNSAGAAQCLEPLSEVYTSEFTITRNFEPTKRYAILVATDANAPSVTARAACIECPSVEGRGSNFFRKNYKDATVILQNNGFPRLTGVRARIRRDTAGAPWRYLIVKNRDIVENLGVCGDYEYSLQNICASDTSTWVNKQSLEFENCDDICYSYGDREIYWPTDIVVGQTELSYFRGHRNTGYYSSEHSLTLDAGQVYPLIIAPQRLDTIADDTLYWGVWLDLNGDGYFNGPEEELYRGTTYGLDTLRANFRIPEFYNEDRERRTLRIALQPGSAPEQCQIGGNLAIREVKRVHLNALAPTHDLCGNATPIVCGDTIFSSLLRSTPDSLNNLCVGMDDGNSVWYIVEGTGDIFELNVINHSMRFSIYTGTSCAEMQCVDRTTRNISIFDDQYFAFATQPGETYYVRVSTSYRFTTTFVFNLSCRPVQSAVVTDQCRNTNLYLIDSVQNGQYRLSYPFPSNRAMGWNIDGVSDLDIPWASRNHRLLDVRFPSSGTYEICALDDDGTENLGYCCQEFCINLDTTENILRPNYNNGIDRTSYWYTIPTNASNQRIYQVDENGLRQELPRYIVDTRYHSLDDCTDQKTFYLEYLDAEGCIRSEQMPVSRCLPTDCADQITTVLLQDSLALCSVEPTWRVLSWSKNGVQELTSSNEATVDLRAPHTGTVAVTAYDSLFRMYRTCAVEVTYQEPVSLANPPAERIWTVFPIPASDWVAVSQAENQLPTTAQLFDARGRRMATALRGNRVPLAGLPAGVYYLRLADEKRAEIHRLVVN